MDPASFIFRDAERRAWLAFCKNMATGRDRAGPYVAGSVVFPERMCGGPFIPRGSSARRNTRPVLHAALSAMSLLASVLDSILSHGRVPVRSIIASLSISSDYISADLRSLPWKSRSPSIMIVLAVYNLASANPTHSSSHCDRHVAKLMRRFWRPTWPTSCSARGPVTNL